MRILGLDHAKTQKEHMVAVGARIARNGEKWREESKLRAGSGRLRDIGTWQ